MHRHLYGILCRFPEPGKVKTRLAHGIGDERAAECYRRIVETMMRNTVPRASEYERVLFYSPRHKKDAFSQWFPGERLLPQRGNDIGAVMENAIEDLLDMGGTKTIITGSDIPLLGREIISRAFVALDQGDIVIGPAADGGYYLIGMKKPHAGIFQDIPWGSAEVFAATISAIKVSDLAWKTVAMLPDVDTAEDLLKLYRSGCQAGSQSDAAAIKSISPQGKD